MWFIAQPSKRIVDIREDPSQLRFPQPIRDPATSGRRGGGAELPARCEGAALAKEARPNNLTRLRDCGFLLMDMQDPASALWSAPSPVGVMYYNQNVGIVANP